jgi:hypothetical protein
MWNVEGDSKGVSEVTAACGGGLQAVLGDRLGLVLGGEGVTNLWRIAQVHFGLVRARQWCSHRDGGASARHDSKIS